MTTEMITEMAADMTADAVADPAAARATAGEDAPGAAAVLRFTAAERRLLLTTSGIGQGVVDRIEQAGVHSLRQLHALGVDAMVERICDGVGSRAWRNRRGALARALAARELRPAR